MRMLLRLIQSFQAQSKPIFCASRGCTAARSVAKGRFSHFPADNMKPIQQRVQRCAWLVQGEWTVPSASHADYERETGLTIGDGPVEDA